jgi:hypothetical protein
MTTSRAAPSPATASRNQPRPRTPSPILRTVTGANDLDSADGIRIIGNNLTGRGIYGALTSNGVISRQHHLADPLRHRPGHLADDLQQQLDDRRQ